MVEQAPVPAELVLHSEPSVGTRPYLTYCWCLVREVLLNGTRNIRIEAGGYLEVYSTSVRQGVSGPIVDDEKTRACLCHHSIF
ncbi:uncharacterized protein H6S33_009868 [Morchella sextelata]|uniref:uncharacterized protein n=1 Tax=Morchella sextelata TaxID=1174677 RepID=UPI001D03B35B|nr:uncharacterized protein H6S33_009868 [Morchella sextelata]KAH0602258.1 hypothetical protein H6S33_009868 [Morchella sextelata]